jgi:hypothetical protein
MYYVARVNMSRSDMGGAGGCEERAGDAMSVPYAAAYEWIIIRPSVILINIKNREQRCINNK